MSTETEISTNTLPVEAGTWKIDPAHSSVEFVVRHMGLSKVRGRFGTYDATLVVGADPASSSLNAQVDMSSVDTGNADRDAHLAGTDFFDAQTNPTMTFRSTRIDGGPEEWVAHGELTIAGTTLPAELDIEFNGTETFPMDQSVHAGFSATTTISRKAYGVEFDVPLGGEKVMIGDKVTIELEAQFAKAG